MLTVPKHSREKCVARLPRRRSLSLDRNEAEGNLRANEANTDKSDILENKGVPLERFVVPRSQLHVPQESSLPVPLKYQHVTNQSETDSKSAAERTINDCWNIEDATAPSDGWVGPLRFQVLRTLPAVGYKSVEVHKDSGHHRT